MLALARRWQTAASHSASVGPASRAVPQRGESSRLNLGPRFRVKAATLTLATTSRAAAAAAAAAGAASEKGGRLWRFLRHKSHFLSFFFLLPGTTASSHWPHEKKKTSWGPRAGPDNNMERTHFAREWRRRRTTTKEDYMQLGVDGEKLSWGMELASRIWSYCNSCGRDGGSAEQNCNLIPCYLSDCGVVISSECVCCCENSWELRKQSCSRSGSRVKAHSLTHWLATCPLLSLLYWTGLTTPDSQARFSSLTYCTRACENRRWGLCFLFHTCQCALCCVALMCEGNQSQPVVFRSNTIMHRVCRTAEFTCVSLRLCCIQSLPSRMRKETWGVNVRATVNMPLKKRVSDALMSYCDTHVNAFLKVLLSAELQNLYI